MLRYFVVVCAGVVFGLAACSGGVDESTPTVGGASESVTEAESEAVQDSADDEVGAVDGTSLESVLTGSSEQDFLREFYLDGSQLTSRFVLLRGIGADGGDIAVEISVDPSGLDNFTLAPADLLTEENPFVALQAVALSFPELDYVAGTDLSTFSASNGQTSVIFSVDSEGLLRSVEYTSPEYASVENFSYGSEFEETVPREFVERVNVDREQGGLDFIYGFTQDGFASWEVTTF